ncbi:hypothetical protein B296_00051459 [Ensete ventricosum]|uniref:Uncharacterized protein n=1 Tax=Ensete ventricosum TaxID=4639 RepID=A0A426YDE9_ENSVE|nr:hypothetical protein B296_00051459 [Ensete ventricosum]
MGRGRNAVLALFGLKRTHNQGEEEAEPRHSRKVRPGDGDGLRWYGEHDVDVKAKEYIDKVHRNLAMDRQDMEAKEFIDKVHRKMKLESQAGAP